MSPPHDHADEVLLSLWLGRDEPAATPAAALATFAGDEVLLAFARPDRPRVADDDPVSELAAVLASAVARDDLRRAAMLVPTRLRDLEHDQILFPAACLTTLERDGEDWSMRATMHPLPTVADHAGPAVAGTGTTVLVDASPVGSLLWDTTRCRPAGPLELVVPAARILGIDVVHGGAARAPDVDDARRDRVRRRLRRLADELHHRHKPQAPWEVARRLRLPVPLDLPDGFVPACPL